jgi:phospholipid/cholesterol/gamma-HCH transport system substrate-binding protein
MGTPARLAGVGLFVIGGVALFAIGLFMIGDRQMAFAKTFTVYTEFTKITGLQPGAIVRVSGAKAGSITRILPPSTPREKFRVELQIAETLHPLVRADSLATIETEGLVGGNYLGIGTGSADAPPVAPDGTIAGVEPFDIADLMQQMGETIAKVNLTFDDMKGDVQEAVVAVGGTMNSANALITDVSVDVKRMAASGARLTDDTAHIAESIRDGRGIVGKLVNDDALYARVMAIAQQTEETATNARQVVELAPTTLEGLQAKDGPVQGMSANVTQTMGEARTAMAGLSDNMDALKRNFLVRGFFNRRGYFDLAEISPAAYRQGVLTKSGGRQLARTWLRAEGLFAPDADGRESLTEPGKVLIDAAIAPALEYVASGIVVVEGYAQDGPLPAQYLQSRDRAASVREYLIGRFHLDPGSTGAMPLGAMSTDSPGRVPWNGVALAVILAKGTVVASTSPARASP